jgi:hypothetical protein
MANRAATRFAAGADALQTGEAKASALMAQASVHRPLPSVLSYGAA